jgi:hypothetical protein
MKKRNYNFKNLEGKVFFYWTVIKLAKISHGLVYWEVKCKCGNVSTVWSVNLMSGKTKSCGCWRKEVSSRLGKINTKHGMEGTRFYGIWGGMKSRCLNPNDPAYKWYGGNGIKVCKRWFKFKNFMEDMYESYLNHVEEFGEKDTTLDRFPNQSGDYKFSNCRWATTEEQGKNRRDGILSKNYKEHLYWKSKLSTAINKLVDRVCHTSFIEKYLGCTITKFKQHIESQFTEGMNWDNHGTGYGKWQFDHIVGCNNFDLSKEEDRKKCFHYTNLHPMWWKDHKKKSKIRLI